MAAMATAAQAPGGVAQTGAPVQIATVRRRSHKTPMLGVRFDGDPQQLEFFPAQIWTYMQKYGHKIATEGGKVCVTKALERMKRMAVEMDGHHPQ